MIHSDDGDGLGASHQTGWRGLVADINRRRHGVVPSNDVIVYDVYEPGPRS